MRLRIFPAVAIAVLFSVAVSGATRAAVPKVVATIPPVHSLTAMVMKGVGVPQLLLGGGETPHSYAIRPSQSRMLAAADIVIRVGDGLESFLTKPLQALAGRATIIALDRISGMKIYRNRSGGDHGFAADKHGHDHDGDHGIDPHIWLDTRNAVVAIREIARVLSGSDPTNASAYASNASRATARLHSLKLEMERIVRPIRDRPFFVFHDAWQYFEKEFGLRGGGAIAVSPERKPGARRLAHIRARIRSSGANCVFAEPQFPPALVKTVIRRTPAKLSTLDPLGLGLTRGPELYPALMLNLANGIFSCLNAGPR